tara:strand:+ start:451 stop:600 length:150 start_codon:yes stop_codon:yes gene_type:complete
LIRARTSKAISAKIRLQPRVNVEYVIDSSNSLAIGVVLDLEVSEFDLFV